MLANLVLGVKPCPIAGRLNPLANNAMGYPPIKPSKNDGVTAMKISYENLMSAIGDIAAAERITKAKLASLSRDMLVYLIHTQDVRPINALMGTDDGDSFILTPINWRIAAQYFEYFLPFKSNYAEDVKAYATKADGERVALVFAGKNKRQWAKKSEEIQAFLSDDGNNIWTWSTNVEMEAKPVDYSKRISQAVKAGVNKGDMTSVDVLCAVLEAEGMDMGQLLAAMDKLTEQAEAA